MVSIRSLLTRHAVDRDILRLAVPALGALIAEPLFLLADSAMVGHLGAEPLAGLGLASAVLQTIVGLMVFLAYSTTPLVARRLGAGDRQGALGVGIDGLWLALVLGILLAAAGAATSGWLVGLFGANAEVTAAATAYLAISMAGLPAMLLVFAATGLLRGLQDTRTPLWVAGVGFVTNIALNAIFIYGLGLGVVGSAVGTVIAQWGMVAVYLVVVLRHARQSEARLTPRRAGLRASTRSGGWLLVRTMSLRAAMLLAVYVATQQGAGELAAFQVAATIFATLAFALDSLAIAAQALVGQALGAGDVSTARAVMARCLQWAIGGGLLLGIIVMALSPVTGPVFTGAPEVLELLPLTLVLLGAGIPLAGFVFVLDGVLIGAGDVRYLALTGLVNVAVFAPMAWTVLAWAPEGVAGLAWLWVAFGFGYIGARAMTLGWRSRGRAWMVTGSA